jgi:hypothetical protein
MQKEENTPSVTKNTMWFIHYLLKRHGHRGGENSCKIINGYIEIQKQQENNQL